MSDLCATPPEDLIDLAEVIAKARLDYLNAVEHDLGAWVARLALAEILWDNKGTFAPALLQAALYPAAAAEIERLRSGDPVAWIYETWNGEDSWSAHLTFDRPAGNSWQRRIVPLYAAPQPQPDVKPPAAAVERAAKERF